MRVLQRHADGSGWLENLLDDAFARAGPGLAPADRGLAQELAFGIVRWQAALDWLIARKTDGRPQKTLLQILLRLGLYQLFWLDRVPDHAAVHETVELAKRLGLGPQAGFLNAVLRGCARERDALRQQLDELKTREPHLGCSHPQWLCERWAARWGADKLRALLDWNNIPPLTFARVNTLRTTPEKLAAQFEQEGVLFTPRPYDWVPAEHIFELREHPSLATLPSFQQGHFYIQDPSTLLAVRLLDPQPGERILDLCAAPGGKTTFAAQLMRNEGSIVAHDNDASRLKLVAENCARLGVTCVNVEAGLLSEVRERGSEEVRAGERALPSHSPTPPLPHSRTEQAPFDKILIDAPCSNTGVMRRRVELRWRVQPAEIDRLRQLQLDLLRRAAPLLKPGGVLVYSTCALEPEENEGVVQNFLAEEKQFRLDHARQLLPFADGVDGAYVARLRKE